jgi:hypothetical protein
MARMCLLRATAGNRMMEHKRNEDITSIKEVEVTGLFMGLQ